MNLEHIPAWHIAPRVATVLVSLLCAGRFIAWVALRLERFTRRFFPTWAALAALDGWTEADTARLRDFFEPLQ